MNYSYNYINVPSTECRIQSFGKRNCNSNSFYTEQESSSFILCYIKSGKGTLSVSNHQAYMLSTGDLFLLPRKSPYFYQADLKNPWSYNWIAFSGIKIYTMISNSIIFSKKYLHDITKSETGDTYQKLFSLLNQPSSLSNEAMIESLSYLLFYFLMTEYADTSENHNRDYKLKFNLAVNYIEQNFTEKKCSINTICNHLKISRSYLYTLFLNKIGLSPRAFIKELRINEAKKKLCNTNISIGQIAEELGFSNQFNFSRSFKRSTKMSPKAYQKSMK